MYILVHPTSGLNSLYIVWDGFARLGVYYYTLHYTNVYNDTVSKTAPGCISCSTFSNHEVRALCFDVPSHYCCLIEPQDASSLSAHLALVCAGQKAAADILMPVSWGVVNAIPACSNTSISREIVTNHVRSDWRTRARPTSPGLRILSASFQHKQSRMCSRLTSSPNLQFYLVHVCQLR